MQAIITLFLFWNLDNYKDGEDFEINQLFMQLLYHLVQYFRYKEYSRYREYFIVGGGIKQPLPNNVMRMQIVPNRISRKMFHILKIFGSQGLKIPTVVGKVTAVVSNDQNPQGNYSGITQFFRITHLEIAFEDPVNYHVICLPKGKAMLNVPMKYMIQEQV